MTRYQIILGPQLSRLVEADKTQLGGLVRRLLANHYGQPELADEVKRAGRPRAEAKPKKRAKRAAG